MSFGAFFIGIIMIALGTLGLKYNYQVTNSFGAFGTLEKFFGPGREYAFFKLLGIVLIIIGFLTMFGLHDELISFFFAPIKNILQPGYIF